MSDELDLDALAETVANRRTLSWEDAEQLIALARRTEIAESRLRSVYPNLVTERDAALARCADLEAALTEARDQLLDWAGDRLPVPLPLLQTAQRIDRTLARSVPVPQEPKS